MAGESSQTFTYTTLLTTTLQKVLESGVVHDQIFTKVPLLKKLRESGNVKIVDSGERLRVNLMYEANGTYTRYSDYDTISITPSEGFTTAWFNWKQAGLSIAYSGAEKRKNGPSSRISDIVKGKIEQGVMTLVDNIATDVDSDGTADGSKQITGLQAMIDTTPTTTSYAGIDPAVNTAWRNQIAASVGAASTNLLSNLRTVTNQCTQGQGAPSSPDCYLTTRTVHEAAEALLFPQVRYTNRADADGSVNPYFRGVEIMWDDHCASGVLYVLNTNHIYLVVHKDANFTMDEEGFQKPINQDARVTQALFMGNLVTNNRRKLGKLQGIT